MIDKTGILFLIPVGLFLLWFVGASLAGRQPRRFTVNVVLSLVLLLYFLGAAGTGIFWVATQELPVFDWHYLLGYILLLLVIVHLVLNWSHVTALLRRRAPAAAKTAGGSQFKGWVKACGWSIPVLGLGFLLFQAGGQYASKTVNVYVSPETQAASGAEQNPSVMVGEGAAQVSMAEYYHRGSSYPARSALSGVTWQSRPAVYKEYDGAKEVSLPISEPEGGGSLLEATRTWRQGARRFAPSSLTLAELSLILFHAQGITKVQNVRGMNWDFRAAPSAGALYPSDLYVAANSVEGIAPGLYYYNVKQHSLALLRSGPCFDLLEASAGSPHYYQPAAATVIVSVTYGRTGFKYKERAYRYVNMDSGHAAFQLGVAAASLGFAAPIVARFDDQALDAFLEIDGETESSLFLMPLGRPLAIASSSDLPEPRFVSALLGATGSEEVTFCSAIHTASSFRRQAGWGRFPGFVNEAAAPAEEGVWLLDPARGDDLYPVIRSRRSTRDYTSDPIALDELSALCVAAVGEAEESADPLLSGSAPIILYAVVRDVEDLEPGAYRFEPATRSLVLIQEGDLSTSMRAAAGDQEFCGTADVMFVKTVRWQDLPQPDGDRGYRYANIRSGIVGGALYLQAVALGLGVCGVGAFLDGDVAELIRVDPDKEAVLYLTAVGR